MLYLRVSSHVCSWTCCQEELAALREKVEKLEKDNTVYKHENDKLESKVRDVAAAVVTRVWVRYRPGLRTRCQRGAIVGFSQELAKLLLVAPSGRVVVAGGETDSVCSDQLAVF